MKTSLNRDDLKKEPFKVAICAGDYYSYSPLAGHVAKLSLNGEWHCLIVPMPEEPLHWASGYLYTTFGRNDEVNYPKLYAEKVVELEETKRALAACRQTLTNNYDGIFSVLMGRIPVTKVEVAERPEALEEEAAKAKEAEKLLGRTLLDSLRCWLTHEQKRQT